MHTISAIYMVFLVRRYWVSYSEIHGQDRRCILSSFLRFEMTLLSVLKEDLPLANEFLNSVYPGALFLDHNVHYSLKEDFDKIKNKLLIEAEWPLGRSSSSSNKMVLAPTYLNIAKPPADYENTKETITYQSLPFHITNLFDSILENTEPSKIADGGMQIGANVNPLTQDPFRLVHLSPGCLTAIIEYTVDKNEIQDENFGTKNPFNKLSLNFNKFLKLGSLGTAAGESKENTFSLLSATTDFKTADCSSNNRKIIESLLDFDEERYFFEFNSSDTAKLLVSVHTNVLNIIALDTKSNFKNTTVVDNEEPGFPLAHNPEGQHNNKRFSKVIEKPILRVQFRRSSLATSMKAFTYKENDPIVILGFDSGEVVLIDLATLRYSLFDIVNSPYEDHSNRVCKTKNISRTKVTCINTIMKFKGEFYVTVGYSNGEIAIFDPMSMQSEDTLNYKYVKRVVGKDDYITYFKKFDLSPFAKTNNVEDGFPPFLVGHFKVSLKPITTITSTIPYTVLKSRPNFLNPMLLAIASDDGMVRFIDLAFTHGYDYGNESFLDGKIMTDIISNYFHDGILSIEFSPDFKFLGVVGKGDLIEIFKLTYYNLSGILAKTANGNSFNLSGINSVTSRRSRSGTTTSNNSLAINNSINNRFLSPVSRNSNMEGTFKVEDGWSQNLNRLDEDNYSLYTPILKDIKIICRFKGHNNMVRRIKFIKDELAGHQGSSSTSHLVYNLLSCGYDGRILVWEFDYKALPKVKKPNYARTANKITPVTMSQPRCDAPSHSNLNNAVASTPSTLGQKLNVSSLGFSPTHAYHAKTKSITLQYDELPSIPGNMPTFQFNPLSSSASPVYGKLNNVASILNSDISKESTSSSISAAVALYKSLYDLRYRKHYTKLALKQKSNPIFKRRYNVIIHPVVDDTLVPSIEIPLLSLDLSRWAKDCKIDDIYLDDASLWCFAKSGDLFKYNFI